MALLKRLMILLVLLLVASGAPVGALTGTDYSHLVLKDGPGFLDVREFGAKGDGVTDDTIAVQRAIDQCSGTTSLFFSSGTYMISHVDLHSGSRLFGTGTVKAISSTTAGVDHLLSVSGTTGVWVSNMKFNGNLPNRANPYPVSAGYAIGGDNVASLRVDNCNFEDFWSTAIGVSACSGSAILYNSFKNIGEHGVYFSTKSKNLQILGNAFENVGLYGNQNPTSVIKLRDGVSDTNVSGNSYSDYPSELPAGIATTCVGFLLVNVSSAADSPCARISVSNNVAEGLNQGIHISSSYCATSTTDFSQDIVVASNMLTSKASETLYAILAEKVGDVTFSGNKFYGFSYGAYFGGYRDVVLDGNEITASDAVTYGDGLRLQHTVFNNIASSALVSYNANVHDNVIDGYRYALYIQHTNSTSMFSGNDLRSSKDRTIQVESVPSLWSSPVSGSETIILSNNYLFCGSATAHLGYFNPDSSVSDSLVFSGNRVETLGRYPSFAMEECTISNNTFTGEGYPFTVTAATKAKIFGNICDFSLATLALTAYPYGAGTGSCEIGANYTTGGRHLFGYVATPTVGTWSVGDVIFFSAPTPGGKIGSVYVASGTSRAWKDFGAVDSW